MNVNNVFACIAVADHDTLSNWYERFLGRRADDRPMDGLAEWHYPSGHIQLVADPHRAGSSLITLQVDSLTGEIERLSGHDITPDAVDTTTSEFVLFATISDPEGTTISLIESRSA